MKESGCLGLEVCLRCFFLSLYFIFFFLFFSFLDNFALGGSSEDVGCGIGML